MTLSYILPFYKKADLFRMVLPLNDCFRHPDAEVICVLDDPSDEVSVLETVKANPDIKFRVIVNDWEHPWRPPCIPYNVGVRYAESDHIVLSDPESVISLPRPDYLQAQTKLDYRLCFAGVCWYGDDFRPGDSPGLVRHKIQVTEASRQAWLWGYGLFLCPKIAYDRICGFDEQRTRYGLDDNEIRARVTRFGYRCVVDGSIKIFHAGHPNDSRSNYDRDDPNPHIVLCEQREFWGQAFKRIAYDWKQAK
jgi:hypothetical protein